jgi:hypothetical protein
MCATRRAVSRRPSAAQLIAKIRGSTMGATVTVRAQVLIAGMTRRSRTGSGSERRTAYLDLFLGGAGNPPRAASRVRASASQARTVASNGRYATSRGADTSGKQSRFRPFGRLRRRAESSRLMRSQAPLDREDRRAINLNGGLNRHAGEFGTIAGPCRARARRHTATDNTNLGSPPRTSSAEPPAQMKGAGVLRAYSSGSVVNSNG